MTPAAGYANGMPRRPYALLVVLAVLVAGTGCGGSASSGSEASRQSVGGGGGDNELSASDTADVLGARRTIDNRCGGDRSNRPQGQDIPAAVQTLVRVTQLFPDKVYETGSENRAEAMRAVAGQVRDELRGCGIADQAARLARVAKA